MNRAMLSVKPPQRAGSGMDGRAGVSVAVLPVVLAIASFLVYSPVLRNGFIDLDDPAYVTQNDHVRTGLNWKNVLWALSSTEAANWHPLTWLSHMIDCQIFGLDPAWHHAVNAMLHAVNATLLFVLLQKATQLTWRSFLVAALFAVHPLNVESVAWVSERKSLLCMFFSLCCVAFYAEFVRSRRWTSYLAVVVCFALALFSKPMAVTLPILLLLLDYWPLERFPAQTSAKTFVASMRLCKPLLIEKIPLFAMSAASSWVTVVAQRSGHAVASVTYIPMWQRWENAGYSYVKYVQKMFWPTQLAYIYPHPGGTLAIWKVLLSVVVLCGITALAWQVRKRRHLLFGWLLYLIALLPVIGIIQVGLQGMADRYAYLPMIGIFVIVVWELSETAAALRISRAVQVSVALAILVTLSGITAANARYWRSNLSLFTRAHEVTSPPYFQIEVNLGAALNDAGRTKEALQHFRIAEQLGPDLFTPHFNIGYLLAQEGNNGEAVPELLGAIRCAKNQKEEARAWNTLAVSYLELQKNDEAADAFSRLLSIQPHSRAGFAGRGQARFNMGRYREASDDFERALHEHPAPELFLMAGKALEKAGQSQQAADYYRRALKEDPQLTEAQRSLDTLQHPAARQP
jgi:Flp pilus assembly protein TadD